MTIEYKDLLCMNCQHLIEKSEWLQFNNAMIRKSSIDAYGRRNHEVILFYSQDWFNESFETEQEAQARLDEIDKEIRG